MNVKGFLDVHVVVGPGGVAVGGGGDLRWWGWTEKLY